MAEQQILLYYLKKGMPYDDALVAMIQYRDDKIQEIKALRERRGELSTGINASSLRLTDFWRDSHPDRDYLWPPEELRLRG